MIFQLLNTKTIFRLEFCSNIFYFNYRFSNRFFLRKCIGSSEIKYATCTAIKKFNKMFKKYGKKCKCFIYEKHLNSSRIRL